MSTLASQVIAGGASAGALTLQAAALAVSRTSAP
jgi:hypothetical protein